MSPSSQQITPRFYSLSDTARTLGIAPSTLSELRRVHPVWRPTVDGLAGETKVIRGRRVGSKLRLFHARHLDLLVHVLVGAVTADTASMAVEIYRRTGRWAEGVLPDRDHVEERMPA